MVALSLQASLQILFLFFLIFLPDVNSFCRHSIHSYDQNIHERRQGSSYQKLLVPRQPFYSTTQRPKTLVQSSIATTALASSFAAMAMSALDSFWRSCPYGAAAVTCAIKASAADLVAQKRAFRKRDEKLAAAQAARNEENKSRYVYNSNGIMQRKSPSKPDMKRNFAYLMYGAIYQGLTQEFIYNHIYPNWFGRGNGLVVVMTKVLFDMFVQTTVLTLPIAYLTKAMIFGHSMKEGMARYIDDIKNHHLLTKYFLLWGPVQCITFSVVPEHLRVSFVACVSFFWLIILSSITAKERKPLTEVVRKPETKAEVDLTGCELIDGVTCNIDG